MPERDFASLLSGLPPEPASVLAEIRSRMTESDQKVVVLDDDPTGTQTVHGVSVLTEWFVPSLIEVLESSKPVFYILTNSRSLPLDSAQELNRELGENLKQAFAMAGQDAAVISRNRALPAAETEFARTRLLAIAFLKTHRTILTNSRVFTL